jgi:hypothetical protein
LHVSAGLTVEIGRHVPLPLPALLALRKDLLVARLDLLESDGLALLLPEPVGDRLGTLLVATGHVESLARKSHLGGHAGKA